MLFSLLAQLCATLVDLLRIARLSSDDKDLEILILRQQLDILARKQTHAVRPSRQEKWTLAVLAASLKRRSRLTTGQLSRVLRIFKPATMYRLVSRNCSPHVDSRISTIVVANYRSLPTR